MLGTQGTRVATPHDALFKAIFAAPEDAAGLIRPLLPAKAAAAIDWTTLKVVPGSFVDDALRHRHADLLFAVDIAGRPGFVFILLEHRSRSDRFMALQLLGYLLRIWAAWRKQNPRARHLPRIVPIVLHHGHRVWSAPTSLSALFEGEGDAEALAALDGLGADLTFRVDDVTAQGDADLRARPLSSLAQLTLACMRSLRDADPNATLALVTRWLDAVASTLATPGGSDRIVVLWSYVLDVTEVAPERIAAILGAAGPDAEATLMSTAHRLRAQGRVEGQVEGRVEILLRLLDRRFGPLPQATLDRVRAATTADLERWADAILTAPTLDAVLAS